MLVTSSKWTDKDIYHHRVHGVLHGSGDTVKSCSNVCPRRNSISKDSNYTTSPLKPIIVLKGLYG